MISYLLHSSILIAGVVLFYWVFLRKETFYSLNRWTFVICMLLCLSLPLLKVPASLSIRGGDVANNAITNIINQEEPAIRAQKESLENKKTKPQEPEVSTQITPTTEKATGLAAMSIPELLAWVYFFGVLVFFLLFIVQLTILLTKRYSLQSVKTGKYRIVELIKDEAPYSFWNTIFINPTNYDPATYEQIMEHEKLHIDQAHFVDKLLAELIVIIFWFNPFAWMLRNWITNNLEYLTDQSMISKGTEKAAYQMSLLKVSVAQKPYNLTTNYNNSFLKNRILMMNSKKSSVTSAWKYLFILPLFFLSVISLNAVGKRNVTPSVTMITQAETLEQSATTPKSDATSQANTKLNQKPAKTPTAKVEKKKTPPPPKQSTNTQTGRNLDLPRVDVIANTTQGKLILTQGSRQEIRAEGPREILDNLNMEVSNGKWMVGMKKGFQSRGKNLRFKDLVVYATLTDLKSVLLSGTGDIESTNRFKTNNDFSIILSGTGDVNFDVDANNTRLILSGTGEIVTAGNFDDMNVILSGSGGINLSGKARDLDVTLSGSGRLNAENLKAQNMVAKSSGSGRMRVNIEDTITVLNQSGSGTIEYKGNPRVVTKKKSGTGKIRSI